MIIKRGEDIKEKIKKISKILFKISKILIILSMVFFIVYLAINKVKINNLTISEKIIQKFSIYRKDYKKALYFAIADNDLKAVKLLIAKGVEVKGFYYNRDIRLTPLIQSVDENEIEIVKILIENGALNNRHNAVVAYGRLLAW